MPNEIRRLNISQFPTLLKEISDPPKQLFARGNLPQENNFSLCVVGSRKFTQYGKAVCQHLITGLQNLPVTIVSGLALGIDSIAHETALKIGLQTIAIPGSGLDDDIIYPVSNRGLAMKILKQGGGLISEYEPSFRATMWSFPKRNRIMTGMSHATLVIESTERSGTLITARLAYEYNRDVLAVPGSIFSPNSSGTNKLIQDGATPIVSIQELIEAIGLEKPNVQKHTYENCTPNEIILVKLLTKPKERKQLMTVSSLSQEDFNAAITLLDMKGHIEEKLGKIHLCF